MKKLNESGIKLTELEKEVLQCIRNQGSFYEEGLFCESHESPECECVFFGWEIYESEVKGCRGAISSLVKKGVLDTYEEDGYVGYIINYALTFDKDDKYKIIFN